MSKANITFHTLIQNIQELGGNQNHMISRAFFILEHGGKTYTDMSVNLRQPFGSEYAGELIEVEKPSGSYSGNWNHNDFGDVVEDYYRSAIGGAFGIGSGVNIRMQNNMFDFSKAYGIELPDRNEASGVDPYKRQRRQWWFLRLVLVSFFGFR